jgi:hypothetical protein
MLREAESGDTVMEIRRKHGISQQSFYLHRLTPSDMRLGVSVHTVIDQRD